MSAQADFPPIDECPPIDLSKQYELRYWSNRFRVSHDQLRAAVAQVGTRPREVEQHLAMAEFAYLTPPVCGASPASSSCREG